MPTTEDAHAQHREEVMRGVRVVVHAAKERRRRVFADVAREEVPPAGVRVEEGGDVVDEAGDEHEGAGGALFLDCVR